MFDYHSQALLTLQSCFDALSVHASGLLAKVEVPAVCPIRVCLSPQPDLSPPPAVDSTLDMLREVLASQDAATLAPEIQRAELAKVGPVPGAADR